MKKKTDNKNKRWTYFPGLFNPIVQYNYILLVILAFDTPLFLILPHDPLNHLIK